MNYTICTVANDLYSEFLYYFTKSALEKCISMNTLIILYTGEKVLDDPIYKNNKVKIIKYKECISSKDVWDIGWQKNVDLKTQFLRDLATETNDPIFLIDVDCYFLKEFIDIIDMTKDITVTKRTYISPYIASFIGLLKPQSCLEFIDIWRNYMSKIPNAPRETKALCLTIESVRKKILIQEIPETTINCIDYRTTSTETRILHFKGNSIGDAITILNQRLNCLKSIL